MRFDDYVLFNHQDLTSGMVQMVEEGKEVGRFSADLTMMMMMMMS